MGRHRLRREFWQRCDDALRADGALIAAYDRIEVQASAARRSARSQAQAAREEQASQRLHALLPDQPSPARKPSPAALESLEALEGLESPEGSENTDRKRRGPWSSGARTAVSPSPS